MSIKSLLTMSLLAIHINAIASDDITNAMNEAYAPYRVALFKTNSGSAEDAAKAVMKAQKHWDQLREQYFGKAVAPYDRDKAFDDSLTAATTVYQHAQKLVSENKLHEAHEALEGIREIIAELRHRNNVITYSDQMNAYHAQMEELLELTKLHAEKPDFLDTVTMKTGVILYLSQKLETEADETQLANPEFNKLLMQQKQAVSSLKDAVFKHNINDIKTAIDKLKPAYSKLFVKFG